MRKRLLAFMMAVTLCLGMVATAAAFDGSMAGSENIVSASRSTALVDANGDLWMWGQNGSGQLGNRTEEEYSDVPVKIMSDVVSASAGGSISAAVKKDGSLWIWGSASDLVPREDYFNYDFNPYLTTPAKRLDSDVAAVSCGDSHIAIIKTDGSLWVWGHADDGKTTLSIPDADKMDWGVPKKVMDDVVSVSCGGRHTVALKKDGTVWTWGNNEQGQLANDDLKRTNPTPMQIMTDVVSISGGYRHTAAIKKDGTLWVWGSNESGQVGNGGGGNRTYTEQASLGGSTSYSIQTVPVKVLDNVIAVSCGDSHTAAITTDHKLWTWGLNGNGQLGDGTRGTSKAPKVIMENVAEVRCGFSHTIAIGSDGSVWSWGSNQYGQVGNGGISNTTYYERYSPNYAHVCQTEPVRLQGLTVKASGTSAPTVSVVPSVTPPATELTAGFTDVPASNYLAAPVNWAVEKGITNGTTPSTFSPNQKCTNAQILTFLWRTYGQPEPTIANPFTNTIPETYAKAAAWAYEKGIVSGTTFDADKPCTRAMVVTYIWQAMGSPAAGSAASFPDVPAGASYAQAVAWAVSRGITNGITKEDGTTLFTPDETCTRGQIVTFLHRAYAE